MPLRSWATIVSCMAVAVTWCDGARKDSKVEVRSRARTLVHEVYTYGAPSTRKSPFRNAASADGCFPGLRSYNEDQHGGSWWQKRWDNVDFASIFNFMEHAWTPSVELLWNKDSIYTPCNEQKHGHFNWPRKGLFAFANAGLHTLPYYIDRLKKITVKGKAVGEQEPFKTASLFLNLAYNAYESAKSTKDVLNEKMPGWRLVKRLVDVHFMDTDPVELVQNTKTLDCVLAFTGTNSQLEMMTSFAAWGTAYCGFTGVHSGYRNELWTITGNLWADLRPSLEQCNRMTCVGHSLGGALCEVFAACANSGHDEDPDFQRLSWTPGEPRLMAEYER